jgi:N12 class adenine-specific DNA methylase/SAM-dependent methyltransferase
VDGGQLRDRRGGLVRPEGVLDTSTAHAEGNADTAGNDSAASADAPAGKAGDWRPDPAAPAIPNGLKARARANIAAFDVLDALAADARPATAQEQARLAAWSGWGGLSAMFDDAKDDWADLRAQLRAKLSEEDWKSARSGVLNAHYTHPAYVKAIWGALADMGLTRGRVLEPGCGSGTFVGLAPQGVAMTGVELDPTTARVAATLYPSAEIRAEGYQETPTTRLFDGAVGNVPFGDIRLFDPAGNPGGHSIHNHFIVKALSQVKPGGIVAVLTSHYTLDATNPAARRDMQARADLLGAIRLPSGAHERVADTSAVTDLLVFRVREDGEAPQPFTWEHAHLHNLPGADEAVAVNDYLMANPGRILGEMSAGNGMYGHTNLIVTGVTGAPLADQLRDRLALLRDAAKRRGLTYDEAPAPEAEIAQTTSRGEDAIIGNLREVGDTLAFQRLTEQGWTDLEVPKTQQRELRELLSLRDQTRDLLALEASTTDDSPELRARRARLAATYHAYQRAHGPLNRNTRTVKINEVKEHGEPVIDPQTGRPETEESVTVRRPQVMSRFFCKDPHSALTRAIEIYDEDTGDATDAPILHTRQVFARYTPKGADTPADALAISQETKGRVDLDYTAYLLGLDTPDAAREALGDLVFDTPDGALEPREAYLSGNVRAKLDQAREAAIDDPRFEANVRALRQAMPRDLGLADITPSPGAPWIPVSDHQQFLRDTLGGQATVTYNPVEGWKVDGWDSGIDQTATWGTRKKSANSIFQDMLNNKAIRISHKETDIDGHTRDVFEPKATEEARAQAEKLEAAFKQWIWRDPERTARLLADYNRRFNSLVPRTYDASAERLRLPGLASTFTLRDHQKAAIARMIAEPSTGLFHEVGAGKTLEMVCGIMEQKRLGLISKPMVVVPNHMLAQFEREWLQAYPHAKLLAADPNDISNKSGRGDFMARVTTSDWDGIILTQEAFKKVGASRSTRIAYNNRELDELEAWLSTATDRLSVQKAEKKRASLRSKIARETQKAEEQADEGITFEQLGVDYLVVDEAHGYKNLSDRTDLVGVIADKSSVKARDLDMKLNWLRATHGARAVTFATATPIANTMGEMWVMTHYLRPDLLRDAGLDTFNEWAKTFTGIDSKVETTVAGAFKVKQRIARFQNMPELMTMWSTFADVKTRDQLDLKVPDIKQDADGHRLPEVVTVTVGPAMEEFQAQIATRAERIENRQVDPWIDNWLSLAGDGRAMSTDYRLLTGRAADRALAGVTSPIGDQKVDRAADQIARIYHATKDNTYLDDLGRPSPTPGALQMVFADQGTPKKDQWNLYDELKRQLVTRGVPEAKIAFAHDAKNSVEKGQLFAKARSGAIAVLIGSTEKMGTGANMQARAVALHHLTAPWRPADLAQRDGRIIRQGNQNSEVQIYRYVTEGSFDTYMWQTLERKAAFINQVMSGKLQGREVDDADISSEEASYAQVKAIASGNPYLVEEARLKNEVSKFQTRADAHESQQRYLAAQGPQLDRQIDTLTRRAALHRRVADTAAPTQGDSFHIIIGGRVFTERAAAADELTRLFDELQDGIRSPLRANTGQRIDYTMRGGLSALRIHLGGLTLRVGVMPQELKANGEPSGKPVQLTASIDELQDDQSYWQGGGPTFTAGDLAEQAAAIGVIRKLENHTTFPSREATRIGRIIAETRAERAKLDQELGKPNPWTDSLQKARSELAAIHEQMTRAGNGQDTIPGLSSAPTPAPADDGIRTLAGSDAAETATPQLVPPAHPKEAAISAYVAPGITTVRTTSGENGYRVDKERNRQIPEPFRDPEGWYPGVVRASAIAMTFPEALTRGSGRSPEQLRAISETRLREHFPDAWQQWQDSIHTAHTATAQDEADETRDVPRFHVISTAAPAKPTGQEERIHRMQKAAGRPSLTATGTSTTPTHRPPASANPSPARKSALR